MTDSPEYFDRIRGQINVPLLATKHVVVVGVGTVGSPVAEHLAKDGVGSFLFIDGDTYEEVNRVRHVLPPAYLEANKAEAMRDYLLSERLPELRVQALPQYVDVDGDASMSDDELDAILDPADLIITGTGERDVQRRLGARALALDIPAIFPALYPDGGGEVFLQTSPEHPCFFCWDGWRTRGEPVRGAEALGVEAMPVIQTAIELSLGILDPGSRYEQLTIPDEDEPDQEKRNLFLLFPEAERNARRVSRSRGCPSCAVGPSPLRQEATEAWRTAESAREAATSEPPPLGSTPSDPDDEQLWENRPIGIRTVSSTSPAEQPSSQFQFGHSPVVDLPATPGLLGARRRQRNVNRVLLAACAVIAVTLLTIMLSTDSRPPAEISGPVSVKLDYSQSLLTMIAAVHLQTIEHDIPITETQFPVGMSGPETVKVVLIRLTRFQSSEATDVADPARDQVAYTEVEDDLNQLGYRPATLPELLALIAQDPEVQSPAIVALGSPAYHGEDVACEASQGYLQCGSVAHGFDPAAEFVAVPTQGS